MKNKINVFVVFVSLFLFYRMQAQELPGVHDQRLIFPFSQFVIRSDWAMPIVWKYRPFEAIEENETVIAPPAWNENWDAWYKKMKAYQQYLRAHLSDTSTMYLQMKLSKRSSIRLHFKRVLNDMRLLPGDQIVFNGSAKASTHTRFSISLMYIRKGQEMSHAIVRMANSIDTVTIGEGWTSLHSAFSVPDFDTVTLMVQPVVFFEGGTDTATVQVKGLSFSIPAMRWNSRQFALLQASFYPPSPALDRQLYDRKEMQWLKSNFISGFAYLWDSDFWDAERKQFRVQQYCDKMKKAFGGFQSVLVWYSYPNIGIDERNTWEFLHAIPGGINGLKAIVKIFHHNGVKVYFPYTPWEIDTRETSGLTDPQHWRNIIGQIDADGLFFDTFFDAGDFQKELDQAKKGISIGTEHHPSLQNIQGYNAVTTSWGQTLQPYHNNGISRVKWLIPEHIQWKINRNETNRQNSMAYSWINGQGLLIWENVFGYMNTWNVSDRRDLRKMNAIYQQFADLYTSDSWKPYLPSGHPNVHLSSWQNGQATIWNIITDSAGSVQQVVVPVSDPALQYYDCWSGKKLVVNRNSITVPIERFGCVLGISMPLSKSVQVLLNKMQLESNVVSSGGDDHVQALSDKLPFPPPSVVPSQATNEEGLLKVKAGEYKLVARHVKREGGCYPDADAGSNNDYTVETNVFGKEMIVHHAQLTTIGFAIMPAVVTNKAFERFLKASGYHPADTVNYLQHWHGPNCPDDISDKPVVYVSLEDARAYAAWAGMRLPTEWEWQAAGESAGKAFVFNKVFEWNESERFDGHNYFVTLRGGCESWSLKTSDWYFPGTSNNTKPGGAQPLDAHCKYYLMLAGYDRAGTVGFRCMK